MPTAAAVASVSPASAIVAACVTHVSLTETASAAASSVATIPDPAAATVST